MNNQDGGLYFSASIDNEELLRSVDESIRQIQGLSAAASRSGEEMDASFYRTSAEMRRALGDMGRACEIHETELANLGSRYEQLGNAIKQAESRGDSGEVVRLREVAQTIQGEIAVRKRLLQEAQSASSALENLTEKREKEEQATQETTRANVSLRTQIRNLKEEMANLVANGIDEQSDAYKRLVNELGRLQDIQGDISAQGKILANDQSSFQGMLSGLSGLTGAFSAASGAAALFGEENEELQRVMAKVQAIMAITMGMQQVSQALNKDSAFQLVTLNKLKTWWTKITRAAAGAEVAEAAAKRSVATSSAQATTAEAADTAAKGLNTVAAGGATAANLTLAGAIRAVGLAIKSIPVFGWILAGISALITAGTLLYRKFTSERKAMQKANEEFSKSVIESSYKTIGAVENLSLQWSKLGSDMKAKEKFIKDNKKAFDDLGISIKKVHDAENLLIQNKENFINAQIAKARASVWLEKSMDEVKDIMELEEQYSRMPDKVKREALSGSITSGVHSYTSYEVDNEEKKELAKTIDAKKRRHRQMLENSFNASKNEEYYMKKGGLTPLEDKDKDKPTKSGKDPYIEQLDKRKQAYIEAEKMVSSSDEKTRQEGERRWEMLKAQGETYLDYLKTERDKLEGLGNLSAKQQAHLMELYKRIGEEDKKGLLDLFGDGLKQELATAEGIVDKLDILRKAASSASGDTGLDKGKREAIKAEEERLLASTLENYLKVQSEHRKATDAKVSDYERYAKEVERIEAALAGKVSDIQRQILTTELQTARIKREDARANEYEALIKSFQSYEERRAEIALEYEKKIALAGNDEALKSRIAGERDKKQSSLAVDELQKSEAWSNLFSDLDSLASEKIEILIAEIESKFSTLSGVFNPIDLDAIRKKLNEARSVLIERNPFAELGNALKAALETSEGENRKSTEQIKLDWKNLAQATSKSFDFVHEAVESCAPLKEVIGEVGETALGSLEAVAAASIAVATAIKAAETSTVVLAIIQAALVAVQAIGKLLQIHDNKREKAIEQHSKNIKRLEHEYQKLERAIEKAFGSEKYQNASRAIKNLEKSAEEARKKAEEERKKKKPKEEKAEEYEQEAEAFKQKQEDLLNKLRDEIIGGSAASIAEELGNAIVDACARGEDAIEALGKSVDKIVQNIAKKMIVQSILGKQIENVIKDYEDKWKDKDGNIDPNKVIEGAEDFSSGLKDVGERNKKAIEALLEKMGISFGSGSETTLRGAAKGVTEKTGGLIEGQMNAIRINQQKGIDIMREILFQLSAIERNTRYLASIDRKLDRLNNNRAYGA
ncbi:hypothetical protein [Porphyromonas endodontalis]|uniref:hypothetical protein n=1 Tax=Porphyromonas endodontalis TaxID=28124 RepID=UPI0028E72DDD|nr:hypothetical protein [Porphyromonas endodontalis]